MRRQAPVRFLGGGGAARHFCYPTNSQLRPLIRQNIHAGNGRSQGGVGIARGRRRGDGISKEAVKERRRQ